MKRIVLTFLGCLALVLGGIGILLPLLPTTPFVLLAAGCFSASSPRLYRRLEQSRLFGEYLRNYRDKTGISRGARFRALFFLWLTIGISLFFLRPLHLRIVLGAVCLCVTIHLLTIPKQRTKTEEDTVQTVDY